MSKKNKIILGTVQFGLEYGINNKIGKLPKVEIFELLEKAYDLGVRVLDTAEAYGDAHDIIKEFHDRVSYRFKIISKFSSKVDVYDDNLIQRIRNHTRNFDVNQLKAYFFHSYSDFQYSIKKDPSVLKKIKESNLTEKIGVSVYENKEIELLLKHKEINLIQLPFNLFDNEIKRKGILEKAKENGVEIHTRSAFLQGLFFKNTSDLKGNLINLKDNLKSLKDLIKNYNLDVGSVALNYACSKSYIDNVLIGVDNIEQLEDNLNSLKDNLPKDLIAAIDNINIIKEELLNPGRWND
ncbi:aldo/keto reductase [Tenacibaculum sp. 190524A05c]|uniref:aldo/keto reductase n=1 Tax=Tenacibaculum platacis TaxID=3137852 RepID=UPI0031FB413F